MNYDPPYINSNIFNDSYFTDLDGNLSLAAADLRYLKLSGGIVYGLSTFSNGLNIIGDLSINGSVIDLSIISGITPGIISASKSVVVDSNKDITGFLNLTATNSINVLKSINGECFTADNGTVRSALHLLSNSAHIGTTTNHNFNIQANNTNVLQCLSTGNVNIVNHNGSTTGLQLNGTLITSSATKLNYNDITTLGTAEASKTLTLDSSRNITNINQITLTGKLVVDQNQNIGFYRNTGTLDLNSYIGPESGNTSNLTLYSLRGNGSVKILANSAGTNTLFLINSTSTTTPSATNLLTLYGNGNLGLGTNTPGNKLDVVGDINSTTTLKATRTSDGQSFVSSNGTSSCVIYHYLNSHPWFGTNTNHKLIFQTNSIQAMTINENQTISGISTLSATTLSTTNLTLSGTSITSSATEINYLDLTTGPGTAEANKALITDSNNDIGTIRYLKCSKLFVGDTIDSARMISVLDSTMVSTNIRYITLGKTNSGNNSAELSYYHNSDASNQNAFRIGYYGGTIMTCRFDGSVGINTTSPSSSYKLDVSGNIHSNSGYYSNSIQCINNSAGFIGSGGIDTVGDIQTTGRLKCTNSLGFQVFAPSVSNAELRIYAGFGYTYVGNNNDTYAYFGTNNQRFFQCKKSTTGRLSTCFGGDDNQSYPVSISGTTLGSYTGTYGYLTDAGVVSTTTNTAPNIGLYVNGRVLCVGEIDIISDIRRKENIEDLDIDLCYKFIEKCNPVKFNYKGESTNSYGYIAQQVLKNGFDEMVSLHENKDMKQYIDEYGIISPEGAEFSVLTGSIIPILHKLLRHEIEKNKELENRIKKIENIIFSN